MQTIALPPVPLPRLAALPPQLQARPPQLPDLPPVALPLVALPLVALPQLAVLPPPTEATASAGTSRRQRLLGMARAARDTYIPRLTLLVSQLALGVARLPDYDENGLPLAYPRGTTITLFPSYTRVVDGAYVVSVRGWVWCPGLMGRKNRLILSLAKQVVRYGQGSTAAVDRLEDPALRQDLLRDSALSLDAASLLSQDTVAVPGLPDLMMRERLAAFLARSIAGASVSVVVGAANTAEPRLVEVNAVTDANGHFEVEVPVAYVPSVVQVRAHQDDTVCLFQEVHLLANSGVGVISDIDDTIKLTGIVGDKRELMHRLLLGDLASWNLPSVVAWYAALRSRGVLFHYVLNLPWQLYLLIQQYFDTVRLPPGSIHLKQYTGNIILSLMEPSSSRKRKSLFQILAHFPQKLFVCVGDSGEQDLEAYADLAATYPGRVKAIYIRVVPDSFSDVDDARILAELRRMLCDYNSACGSTEPAPNRPASAPVQIQASPSPPLVDLLEPSTPLHELAARKLPPMVPKKPASLRSESVRPPLPERKYLGAPSPSTSSTPSPAPPPPPPRRRTETPRLSPAYTFDNLHRLYGIDDFYELEDVDRRGALWLQRMVSVLDTLKDSGTKLHFFDDEDKDCFDNALHLVDKIAPK